MAGTLDPSHIRAAVEELRATRCEDHALFLPLGMILDDNPLVQDETFSCKQLEQAFQCFHKLACLFSHKPYFSL